MHTHVHGFNAQWSTYIPLLIADVKVQLFCCCLLKKQVGCFNHRVVTTVADKLKRSGYDRFALVLETNCIRQPNRQLPSSSYNHNTLTTLRTSMKESLQMHFKVAVRKSCNQEREAQLL